MPDLTQADLRLLRQAVELSRRSPRGHTYAVGAVIADAEHRALATGYTRETGPADHAEEVALAKLAADDPRLATATIYTSLEPCSVRLSRPRSCTDLILASGIPRVVFAWREPELIVVCEGAERLTAAGRTVIEVPELAPRVREINADVLRVLETVEPSRDV